MAIRPNLREWCAFKQFQKSVIDGIYGEVEVGGLITRSRVMPIMTSPKNKNRIPRNSIEKQLKAQGLDPNQYVIRAFGPDYVKPYLPQDINGVPVVLVVI